MPIRKAMIGSALVFLLMFFLGAAGAGTGTFGKAQAAPAALPGEAQQPTPAAPPGVDEAIRTAFQSAASQNQSLILGFQIFEPYVDHITYSQDGQTALLWMGLRDRETGLLIETEPGLSVATNPTAGDPANPSSWSFMFQTGQAFADQLRNLPPELLTEDVRFRYLEGPAALQPEAAQAVLSGYKLPWTAGASKRVTNSIGHVFSVAGGFTSCPATCRYAFDFADGTMFPLLAAKGGTVRAAKWTCPNGSTDCTNYLILQDESTLPTSYQVYYHLAFNSIPERLRTVGAAVRQGEFIGDTDDTGVSTGHHLHFHVYHTPNSSNWTWGSSVDITFDDVPHNGGRPRTCSEAREYPDLGSQCNTGNLYVSGNTPANPPQGSLDLPLNRQVLTSGVLRVQGTASDDLQITRIQVMANYDGTWNRIDDITPTGNGPYFKDIDLCAAEIPEGPVAVTVRIFDREGSMAQGIPVRQIIKNANCGSTAQPPAPPACIPNANQVALYADPDFRGACKLFDLNNNQGYEASALNPVGSDNAVSILVGSSVEALLYDRSSDVPVARPLGRVETFTTADAGLADNPIGANTVSGLWVVSRGAAPRDIFINPIGSRLTGNNPTSQDSLVLSWEGGGGATSFDVQLSGPGANISRSVTGTSLSVGNLAPGNYTLTVSARASGGQKSAQASFTVSAASLPATAALTVPFQDTLESGSGAWVSNSLWRLGSIEIGNRDATRAWIFNNSTNYSDTTWRAGDLTSPPISLPAGQASFLRFQYFMDTEDGGPYWDQRRVQVSSNNGPFEDLLLLTTDKQDGGQVWLNSGPVSLQKYAGNTIRLRFHFDTVDEDRNSGLGWAIDDITVSTQGPVANCADNNNTAQNAQAVGLGEVVTAAICPEGDLDFYQFSGTAGAPITVDINARTLTPPSRLDSVVQLLDGDGRSVIAESDDEQQAVLVDSLLRYVLQRSGTYFIRVKAWNHPGVGGTDFPYQMDLRTNVPVPPSSVRLLYPSGRAAPAGRFTISAEAADFDGRPVAAVDFYWHGPDWSTGWAKLGTDTNAADGWSFEADPSAYGGVAGSAVYVQAISRTGGILGTAAWDLELDQSLPTSQLNGTPAQVNGTAVQLTWWASDSQNDIARFEVEYQRNSGGGFSGWQRWATQPAGSTRSAWFVGAAGSSYRFRIRAVDRAGNVEPFPDAFEAASALASTCAPDPNENGLTADNPLRLNQSRTSPQLNLCRSPQAGADDVDWLTFDAQAGQELLLMVVPRGGAKLSLSLYSASSDLLGTWQSVDYGASSSIRFVVPRSGSYYLEVKPAHTGLFGTDMGFQIAVGPGNWIYMPEIHR